MQENDQAAEVQPCRRWIHIHSFISATKSYEDSGPDTVSMSSVVVITTSVLIASVKWFIPTAALRQNG